MRNFFLIFGFLALINCSNENYNTEHFSNIKHKDSLNLNSNDEIINTHHYENNIKNGFSLIFDEDSHLPKYIVEYQQEKKDKIIIAFNNNGTIKSFRSANIDSYSQKIKFHKNGVLKSIGNTFRGKADGAWYYFNEKGKLIDKIFYSNGNKLIE